MFWRLKVVKLGLPWSEGKSFSVQSSLDVAIQNKDIPRCSRTQTFTVLVLYMRKWLKGLCQPPGKESKSRACTFVKVAVDCSTNEARNTRKQWRECIRLDAWKILLWVVKVQWPRITSPSPWVLSHVANTIYWSWFSIFNRSAYWQFKEDLVPNSTAE